MDHNSTKVVKLGSNLSSVYLKNQLIQFFPSLYFISKFAKNLSFRDDFQNIPCTIYYC
jgi:hypothetical protein